MESPQDEPGLGEENKKNGHPHVTMTENLSLSFLSESGDKSSNNNNNNSNNRAYFLPTYPWLEGGYKSSVPTSTAGSVKSSRSHRSHGKEVPGRVKWCQGILLTLLILSGCFLIFYPLIMHYIVEGAHANESHSFFPSSKENCSGVQAGHPENKLKTV